MKAPDNLVDPYLTNPKIRIDASVGRFNERVDELYFLATGSAITYTENDDQVELSKCIELATLWQEQDEHIADGAKTKINQLELELTNQREIHKTYGLVLSHAINGMKHPREHDNDGRMQAVRKLALAAKDKGTEK